MPSTHNGVDLAWSLVQTIEWSHIGRTIGNCHATFIGLIVHAWLAGGENRTVLESPPGVSRPGGRIHPDIILVEGDSAMGVVEVEGTKCGRVIEKFTEYSVWKSLGFGLFLAYPTAPRGHGDSRTFCLWNDTARCDESELAEAARVASGSVPFPLLLIFVQKAYKPGALPPDLYLTSEADYYRGRAAAVHAVVAERGQLGPSKMLWEASGDLNTRQS